MGISQIEKISTNLQNNNVSAEENVFIIKNASLSNQKIYKTNLKNSSSFIKKKKKNFLTCYNNHKIVD